MLPRQGGAEKKKEARRSPKTTMHTSGLPGQQEKKNVYGQRRTTEKETFRRCLITNGPADESGEKEETSK
jgi:hypothetical protein